MVSVTVSAESIGQMGFGIGLKPKQWFWSYTKKEAEVKYIFFSRFVIAMYWM